MFGLFSMLGLLVGLCLLPRKRKTHPAMNNTTIIEIDEATTAVRKVVLAGSSVGAGLVVGKKMLNTSSFVVGSAAVVVMWVVVVLVVAVVVVLVVVVGCVVVEVRVTHAREISSEIPEARAERQTSVSSKGNRCSMPFFVKTVAPAPSPHETSSIP